MTRTNMVFWCIQGIMPSCIDEVIIDDCGIQRGLYSGETIDQIALRYDNPQICDADEYIDMQEKMLRTDPVSITEELFQEMLEVLPPVDWRSVAGVTSFKMSERLSGRMTAIYAQKGNRFWTFTDVCSMPAERIAEIINVLDEVKS